MLGAGAMGVVYEAFDRELQIRVALKCLPATRPGAFFRFKQEFRSLHHLHHVNLVRLGELVYESGQLFFTMELIDGCDIIGYCCGDEPDSNAGNGGFAVAAPDDMTLDDGPSGAFMERVVRGRDGRRPPDEAKVRSTFAQLVRGLMALHAANKVHRDVKPSNVLVTRSGRVVLLDFGLVTNFISGEAAPDAGLVGTVGYMAPEQAARRRVGPEADWYSVGAMLFEVLTRRLPFEGRASELLLRQQHELPPRIRDLSVGVSGSFDILCDLLLNPRSEARPAGELILRVLEAGAAEVSPSVPRAESAFFVGRELELRRLHEVLGRVRGGRISAVHIEGQSGTGKTALIQRFVEQVRAEKEILVLSGRCSAHEDVPYKALDGVTDDLAAFVARSDSPAIRAILEQRHADLARAFPVFGRIGDPAEIRIGGGGVGDPYVRRLGLFSALRELLSAVRAQHEVIVALDDMQWADADSLSLLSALMQPPNAPALLFIVATRPHWPGTSLLRAWGAEPIAIVNLAPEESTLLASHLLSHSGCDQSLVVELGERIAAEAGGHPLFINELVGQASREGGALPAPILLEAALWARIERLERSGQALVKLTAVAGSSLSIRVLAEAARLTCPGPASELLSELFALRNERLLRLDGTRGINRVEPYHDRVGAAVRARLSASERLELHRAIASALQGYPAEDPEALAIHWQGAGEPVRATGYALAAARRADEVLAFERAARLYKMALECDPNQANADETREKLGDALANAGLGASAASAYLDASLLADDVRRFELERRAADQLFRSGHIDEAEPLIQRVLKQVGMRVPRTPFWSLVALLMTRLRLAFMRMDVPLVAVTSADARQLVQLNACWSVAVGLSMVSNIRGACVQSRHLMLALRVRQPFPLLRAVAAEACYVAVAGAHTRPRVEKLLRRAEALAAHSGDPYANGFTSLAKSMCSFLVGDWAKARGFAYSAERVFEQSPAGAMWELASARTFGLWSSFYLGDIGAIQARVLNFIHEAEARGDRYASTLHRTGLVTIAWLASDDAETARQQVKEAEAGWSRDTFDFQQYLNTLGHCLVDLYEDSGERAHRRITEIWPALSRSLSLRIQNLRIEAWYLRGVSAIAAAQRGSCSKRLREAERCASSLQDERLGWALTLSKLISAGVASYRGQQERALAHWRAAEIVGRQNHMSVFAELAALRRGSALGGDDGARLARQSSEALLAQQIREPLRLAAVFAPGSRKE